MPTPTPLPPAQAPDPHRGPGSNGWIDFLWRLSGEPVRAAWFLAFIVVCLIAFAAVTALLAPHIGVLGVLSGLGAASAGGAAFEAGRNLRRR